MATTKITYNGTQISSVDETAPVAVAYGGSTIVSIAEGESKTLNCNGKYMSTNVVVGSKTLNCANQMMASDVVVEVEGSSMPTKGQIITMTLGNATPAVGTQDTYRVLSVNGSIALVVAMFDAVRYRAFNSNEYSNTYAGCDVDTYLNTTWYNSLNAAAKAAIQATTITQYKYSYNRSAYDETTHASYAIYSTKEAVAVVGSRYVYALDVEDIETYFNNTFSKADIWTLFWNTTAYPESAATLPWLRSADSDGTYYAWLAEGTFGYVDVYGVWDDVGSFRPAFRIDLSQISWS